MKIVQLIMIQVVALAIPKSSVIFHNLWIFLIFTC